MTMNDYGTPGEPAYNTQNPPPTGATAAPLSPAAPTIPLQGLSANDQALYNQLDQAVQTAQSQYAQTQTAVNQARQALVAAQSDPSKIAFLSDYQSALQTAQTAWAKAAGDLQTAQNNKADEVDKIVQRSDPTARDLLQSQANAARWNGKKIEYDIQESQATQPDRLNQIRAQSSYAQAQAAAENAKTAVLTATTPDQIQQAQIATQQAQANVASTQAQAQRLGAEIPLVQAQTAQTQAQTGLTQAQTGLTGAQTARTAAETGLVGAQQRLTEAQASQVAAQTGLTEAQVKHTEAEIALLGSQGRLTDAQADQVAAQTGLTREQVIATAAQVEATKAGIPLTQAQTEATQATTQQRQLGSLYAMPQRIQEIKNLIASGQLDPTQGNALLQQHITSAIQGTTPFEQNKFNTEQDTTRRGQDAVLAGQRMNDYTSGTTALFNTFSSLNNTVAPGSDAAGRGLIAALNMMKANLGEMGQIPQAQSPLMQSMGAPQSMPQQAPTAMPAMPMAQHPGSQTPITINIGGPGGSPAPQQPAGAGYAPTPVTYNYTPETSAQSAARNGMPAFMQAQQPATPADVEGMWPAELVAEAKRRLAQQGVQWGG